MSTKKENVALNVGFRPSLKEVCRVASRHTDARFRSERKGKDHEDLWNASVFNKQTVRELIESTGHDKKTIFKYLDEHKVPEKKHEPRPIHLVVDATYFGTRIDKTA